ncbi:hypothetical protein AQUCO_00300333v1 [Aquilegia coerulea]|uniref:Uncharacterized protein n=1 Tax=Aquilegia coerulea TaxID=218851 RepID=A0A2G5EYG2_AQUCA|nr:hypothetical protein AQUCO_00300333v1 [Aquilegia coerulea]
MAEELKRSRGGVVPVMEQEDLLSEILIRVPIKSLFRSKVVSKRWRILISDQIFINSYIKRSKSFPTLISGFFYSEIKKKTSDSDGEEINFLNTTISSNNGRLDDDDGLVSCIDKNLSFLSSSIQGSVVILDSSNGILLCTDKRVFPNSNYFVCNPLTKQWISLSKPRDHGDGVGKTRLYCYNVDEFFTQKTEFMVVCVVEKTLEIYSSETRKWKKPKVFEDHATPFPFSWGKFCRLTLFNGSAYWFGGDGKRISVYDFNKEIISYIELGLPLVGPTWSIMGVSDGSMYFAQSNFTDFRLWVIADGNELSLKHMVEYENCIPNHKRNSRPAGFLPLAFHPLDDNLVLVKLTRGSKFALIEWTREVSKLSAKLMPGQIGRSSPTSFLHGLLAFLPLRRLERVSILFLNLTSYQLILPASLGGKIKETAGLAFFSSTSFLLTCNLNSGDRNSWQRKTNNGNPPVLKDS